MTDKCPVDIQIQNNICIHWHLIYNTTNLYVPTIRQIQLLLTDFVLVSILDIIRYEIWHRFIIFYELISWLRQAYIKKWTEIYHHCLPTILLVLFMSVFKKLPNEMPSCLINTSRILYLLMLLIYQLWNCDGGPYS